MAENSIPLILVSASDLIKASYFISELLENEEVDNIYKKPNSSIWHIVNKYYRVEVEVCPTVDSEPTSPTVDLEAHIIYISNEENKEETERIAEERWARATGAERAQVRLLASDSERASPALAAWACRRRYELVPLREQCAAENDADSGPFRETFGMERMRDALHAHTWRGLERIDNSPHTHRLSERCESTEPSEEDVERAEAFAEALGALGEAREAATLLSDGDRRRRAENLVSAFCRALGTDVSAL